MAVVTGDEFRTPISVDDKATGTFKQMNAAAGKTVSAFSKTQAATISLNQALSLLRKGFVLGQRVFDQVIGNYARFETALVGVAKTTNLTEAQTDMLGDALQRLSEQLPTTAVDLAALAQTAGQLGVTGTGSILKFTETMAKLATASDLAGESGATALARILNTTDGGVQNVDRFASTIVALGNQFAATESEIARVATEVARSTSVFNLGSANVAGLSTAMKAMGIQAQLGGSALGRAFRAIDESIRMGGSQMNTLMEITGESAESLRQTFATDATLVFQKFVEGLGRIQSEGGSVAFELSKLKLEGDEINKILPVMAQRSELVGRALSVANDEFQKNTALNEEAGRAGRTLASEWQKFQNVITNALADFGAQAGPALREIVVLMRTSLIETINETKRVWEVFTTVLRRVDFRGLAEDFKIFGAALTVALAPLVGPTMVLALKSLVLWAAPLAVMAVKFAVIAAGALAFAAAVEIVVRNLERMDVLGKVLLLGFQSLFDRLKRGMEGMALIILTGIETVLDKLAGTMFDVGGVATDNLKSVREAMATIAGDIDVLNDKIDTTENKLVTATDQLDLGFAGKAFAEGKKFLESFNKELDKTVAKTGGVADNVQKIEDTELPDIKPTQPVGQVQLFDQGQIDMITGAFGQAAGGMASAASSLLAVPLGMIAAANIILDAVLQLINAIPSLLDKIGKVFSELTEMPLKIAESFENLLTNVATFVSDFIPNWIQAIGDIIESSLDFFASELPDALIGLTESIPEMINKLLDRAPEFAEKLGMGLVNMGPALGIRLAAGLIRNAPEIARAMVRVMITEMPGMAEAFANGVIIALKTAINELANALGLGDIFNLPDLEEKIKSIGDNIVRSSSALFEVIDLEAAARGLDLADRIRNAIDSATRRSANILQQLWDALVRVWNFIRDNIIMPIWNALRALWDFVWVNILKPFVDTLTAMWNFVWKNVLEPAIAGLGKIFLWIGDNVFKPFTTALSNVFNFFLNDIVLPFISALTATWKFLLDNIVTPLITGLTTILKFWLDKVITPMLSGLKTVWDFVKKNIVDIFTNGFSWITSLVNSITKLFTTPTWLSSLSLPIPGWLSSLTIPTPGWLQSFIDAVENLTSFGGFSMGGLVRGVGNKAVDAYKGSDVGKTTTKIGKATGIGSGGGVSVGPVKIGGGGGGGLKLASGGPVPYGSIHDGVLYAQSGAHAIGTDTVPAMLTPGEFVVNREATRNNLGLLSMINSARAPVSPVIPNTTISVVIHTKTDLSADQIRREVIPELQRQLKRKSQEGAFLLANTGLRSNK